jgi:hypothetical protein
VGCDVVENRPCAESGALVILPQRQYRAVVEGHRLQTRYYRFMYVAGAFLGLLALGSPLPDQPPDDVGEARAFLDVVRRHGASMEGRTVVVIELDACGQNDRRVVDALRGLLVDGRDASLRDRVTAVDASSTPGPGDYHLLDGHMRAAGHGKLARLVAAEMARRAPRTP